MEPGNVQMLCSLREAVKNQLIAAALQDLPGKGLLGPFLQILFPQNHPVNPGPGNFRRSLGKISPAQMAVGYRQNLKHRDSR